MLFILFDNQNLDPRKAIATVSVPVENLKEKTIPLKKIKKYIKSDVFRSVK